MCTHIHTHRLTDPHAHCQRVPVVLEIERRRVGRDLILRVAMRGDDLVHVLRPREVAHLYAAASEPRGAPVWSGRDPAMQRPALATQASHPTAPRGDGVASAAWPFIAPFGATLRLRQLRGPSGSTAAAGAQRLPFSAPPRSERQLVSAHSAERVLTHAQRRRLIARRGLRPAASTQARACDPVST